jgi:hypothetical protein
VTYAESGEYPEVMKGFMVSEKIEPLQQKKLNDQAISGTRHQPALVDPASWQKRPVTLDELVAMQVWKDALKADALIAQEEVMERNRKLERDLEDKAAALAVQLSNLKKWAL